jgi:hypothetical protein
VVETSSGDVIKKEQAVPLGATKENDIVCEVGSPTDGESETSELKQELSPEREMQQRAADWCQKLQVLIRLFTSIMNKLLACLRIIKLSQFDCTFKFLLLPFFII